MSKHTPGPWRMAHEAGTDYTPPYFRGIVGPDNDLIRIEGCALASVPEARANAKLVAAAPDLLAALQEINRAQILKPHCQEILSAAIAKATL